MHLSIKAVILVAGLAGTALPAHAQTPAQSRVREITELFNKKKHSKKTKNGVTVEKYREVRSEPMILPNFSAYSGEYFVDGSEMSLSLSVGPDGTVAGSGTEQYPERTDVRRTFKLRNARIESALLTGTKVYGNGSTEPLEGLFMRLSSFDNPNDKGVSRIGLGMVGRFYLAGNVSIEKIFFERRD